jgi:hypothetical protein
VRDNGLVSSELAGVAGRFEEVTWTGVEKGKPGTERVRDLSLLRTGGGFNAGKRMDTSERDLGIV